MSLSVVSHVTLAVMTLNWLLYAWIIYAQNMFINAKTQTTSLSFPFRWAAAIQAT